MLDRLRRGILAASLLCATLPALAAESEPAAPDKFAAVRVLVKAENWSGAIAELQRINDPASAEWNNLLGFSHRKAKTPDYVLAEKYYNEALRIEPAHRGALEYSGELYLVLGKLPQAEQRLAALDKACFLPCEEFTDLKKSIARFKANGNKFVDE